MILNIICYVITGIVAIDLFVNLIITLCNHSDRFHGIERTIAFSRRTFVGQCYITPTISFDVYSYNYEDNFSNFGIEFFIDWLWFGVYVNFTKSHD